jgi:hypothetical protein
MTRCCCRPHGRLHGKQIHEADQLVSRYEEYHTRSGQVVSGVGTKSPGGGKEYSVRRDHNVAREAKVRYGEKCLVSRYGGIQACSIYPWSGFRHTRHSELINCWELLRIFWPVDSQEAYNLIFQDTRPPTPRGTETVQLVMSSHEFLGVLWCPRKEHRGRGRRGVKRRTRVRGLKGSWRKKITRKDWWNVSATTGHTVLFRDQLTLKVTTGRCPISYPSYPSRQSVPR